MLCDISSNIGTPLRIDRATIEGDFGHFARVLIEVDLSSTLQHQLCLDCQGVMYDIDVHYENLPLFCSLCHSIGHVVSAWRQNKQVSSEKPAQKGINNQEKNKPRQSRGRSRYQKVWKAKATLQPELMDPVHQTEHPVSAPILDDDLPETVNVSSPRRHDKDEVRFYHTSHSDRREVTISDAALSKNR